MNYAYYITIPLCYHALQYSGLTKLALNKDIEQFPTWFIPNIAIKFYFSRPEKKKNQLQQQTG